MAWDQELHQYQAQLIQQISQFCTFQVRNKIANSLYHLGAINILWISRNPEKYPQGLLINQGDYMHVGGGWTSSDMYGIIYLWIFYIEGEMGYFADYLMTVSGFLLTILIDIWG
jgi:hypothetical protein